MSVHVSMFSDSKVIHHHYASFIHNPSFLRVLERLHRPMGALPRPSRSDTPPGFEQARGLRGALPCGVILTRCAEAGPRSSRRLASLDGGLNSE